MKAFVIPSAQIAEILGALVTDELGWRFRRYMDTLTIASMSMDTGLGEDGLNLEPAERAACARRAAGFFGVDPAVLLGSEAATLEGWAVLLEKEINRKLTSFRFTAAGRDSETQSVVHPADMIFSDAAAASGLIYGRRRLISLVAPHSLMGFVLTVLTPNLQQIERIDARGAPPEALSDLLTFGDAVVATPSLWRYLMAQGASAPDNVMALYFGEAMPADLASAMRKAGFAAQREIYGSTETGLVGWRDSPGDAFRLFDQLSPGEEGVVRTLPSGGETAYNAMDMIQWKTERSFALEGRRDGAVQIGAVNVFPERIAETIATHPQIESCRIKVGRHEGGFDRLIAHIILEKGQNPTEPMARSIDAYCRAKLHPHERPRVFKFDPPAAQSA